MLSIITQPASATHPYGDFLYCQEKEQKLFRFLEKEEYESLIKNEEYNPVPFYYFGDTARDVLLNKNIFGDAGPELLSTLQYTDFVTMPNGDTRYSLAMTPRIWLTKGGEVFNNAVSPFEGWRRESIFDHAWNRSHMVAKDYNELKPFTNELIMLGSGVVDGFLPEHGSKSVVPVAMDTEQGDILIFLANCWHNK